LGTDKSLQAVARLPTAESKGPRTERRAANPKFSFPVRVYYEDTDAGGVVYYANYLKFMERARTEWLRALGFEQDELTQKAGVVFAVRSAKLEFIKPARFNDRLEVTVDIEKIGRASMSVAQSVVRGSTILCRGDIKIACVDAASFSPRELPPTVAARLAREGAP
jgi:acyl-CoA thioester hydrolase